MIAGHAASAPSRRSRRATWLAWLGRVLALAPLALLDLSARASENAPPDLTVLNQRWQGLECRLAGPIALEPKPEKSGWTSSTQELQFHAPADVSMSGGRKGGLAVPPRVNPQNLHFGWRLVVEDARALAPILRGGVLPPGTVLVAKRWSFHDQAQRVVVLGMRFRDAPVEAQFHFWNADPEGRQRKSMGELVSDVERAFELGRFVQFQSREDHFPVAAASAGVPGAAAAPAARPAAAGSPLVEVLAVSVRPARVVAGEQLELIVTYQLSGAPDAEHEVVETRALLQGARSLARLEDRVARRPGSFTSSQTVQVPADLAPGLYALEVRVAAGENGASGSALFEVR